MNKDTLWLSENPDTGDLIIQLIYLDTGDYSAGWSRYLKDFYTEGWEWEEHDTWTPLPIGSKGLIQW